MPSPEQAGALLDVDLGALVDNYRLLRDRAAPAACGAVVKADGYGLGAAEVGAALAAAGCESFFVAHLAEGIALRQALPAPAIYVLHGLLPGTADSFCAHRLSPVLSTGAQLADWAARPQPETAPPAALHVDTGMNRLGLTAAESQALAADPQRLAALGIGLLISHLVCAEDRGAALNDAQRQRFDAARAALPVPRASLANSSGIFLGGGFHYDLVRPGAALFGVNPTPDEPNPMKQVVALKGKIIQVRGIDSNQTVGYGAAYRARRPRRIATVPVGYADGYFRCLGNRGMGVIAGVRVPVVGRVSMDLTTFDVSDVPEAALAGEPRIELLGPQMPVDEVAATAGTIGYEVLTNLGARYHRSYLPAAGRPA